MKVTIDNAIERNPELLERVHRANAYLEPQLGRFKNDVEAEWTTPPDKRDYLSLKLRFTDEFPVEASDSFSADVLRPDRYAAPWLRPVINKLLGHRADAELSVVRQMLAELANVNGANGAE
jgi:hypothetical protein